MEFTPVLKLLWRSPCRAIRRSLESLFILFLEEEEKVYFEDDAIKIFGVSGSFGSSAEAAAACAAQESGAKLLPNYLNNPCEDFIADMSSWPVNIFNLFLTML